MGGIPRVLFQSLFVGANQKAVEIDAEGLPYCAMLGNEEFITYVQKIISDFSSDNVYLNLRESLDNGLSSGMFKNGQIVFYTRTIWDIAGFRESDFSLGVLPAPKKDAEQDRYYCVTTGGVASVLPSTVPESDKEYTGLLLEAMSFASRQDVLPIYKEVILKSKYSDSQDDSAMVDIIFETQTYDLGITIFGQSGDFINNIMTDLKPDVVSYLAANENKYTTAITKIAEAIEEYIE